MTGTAAKIDAEQQGFLRTGNPRPVLSAALEAARDHGNGVLALVLETEGSTYASAGAMAFFGDGIQVGWLSGGCLEPELALRARDAEAAGRIEWMEIDTRADEDLLSGSALGCRGRLRIAMIPLCTMPGIETVLEAWLRGGTTLERTVHQNGAVSAAAGGMRKVWQLAGTPPEWAGDVPSWSLPLPRPPEALVLGAGPESPMLFRLLRELGWRTTLVESRPRWHMPDGSVDLHLELKPSRALTQCNHADVALVMHHNFELDREALDALSASSIAFVGLLGPRQRRDDLFKLLLPLQRSSLMARLHSPVGLNLGGSGPEAIALSIVAELQAWRASAAA